MSPFNWTRPLRGALRTFHRDDGGQTMPLLIGAMFLFVLFGVLIIDFGMMFAQRREAQRAVDLAALAAAQELPTRTNDPLLPDKIVAAEDIADEFLAANGFSLTGGAVVSVTPSYGGDPGAIEVTASRPYTWLFGRFVGLTTTNISARAVASATSQPRDVVLVLDESGSMCQESHGSLMLNCPDPPGDPDGNGLSDWEPFDTMRDAAKEFVSVLVPDDFEGSDLDRIALVSYSTSASQDLTLTTSYGSASSDFEGAIDDLAPAGYTNVGYGIAQARDILDNYGRSGAVKIIILLSDGYANRYKSGGSDTNPTFSTCTNYVTCSAADSYATDQASLAAADGTQIYTIGYTGGAGAGLLSSIANIGANDGGGGQFFSVTDPETLADTFYEIASLTKVALIE